MAKDVITRFKLETTGFDSKIKQAAKDLSAYSKTATQAKEGFDKFTKSNIDAAKALGTMATSTTNVKDRAKELVGAFNDAAKAYNSLTKEQQQSDWAKALAGSLTQLQQRIKETKQEMQGLGESMKGGGGIFSGIGSKMEGALAVFGGNLMTKAAGAVAQLGSEMADMVKQGVEMAKAGEGVRIAFERLGRGDILDGLREATHGTVTDLELMKAAVKFNDFKLPVEELGTMLAFAQQKAKDTGQSVDYMVDSIVTGLGRKSLMILDNLGLSAAEIKEKMAETGDMTKAVGAIIREQMSKAGDYVETAADRAAQANVSLQNKMEELGRKFGPVEEASNQLWTSMKIGILDIIGGPLATLLNQLTEAGRLKNMLKDMNGEPGSGNTKVDQQLKKLNVIKKAGGSDYMFKSTLSGMLEDYNRQIMALDAQIKNGGKKPGAGPGESQDVRYLQRQMDALKVMRDQLAAGAKELSKPVDVKIETKGAEQNVESLKVKLIELQAQRKKAIAAGDTDLSKNLAKQISQVKADIKGLNPTALTTTHTLTKPEKADETYKKAQYDYQQALAQAALEVKAGTINSADAKKKELQAAESLWKSIGDAREIYDSPKLKDAQAKVEQDIIRLGGEVKNATEAQKKAEQAARELEAAQKKLAEAAAKAVNAELNNDLKGFYQANKAIVANGGKPMQTPIDITYTDSNLQAFIENLKERLSKSDVGSDLYNALTKQLADANMLGNFISLAVKNGIDVAQIDPQALFSKIFGDGQTAGDFIPDDFWKGFGEQFKNALGEELSINTGTGEVKEGKSEDEFKKFNEGLGKLSGGLSQVTGGLKAVGVEIPKEVDQVLGVINGVSQIISGVGTIISIFGTTAITANTTAVGLNTAAIGGLIAALEFNSATNFFGLANGGIVPAFAHGGLIGRAAGGMVIPGNSMSGDRLRMPVDGGRGIIGVNSGELILNMSSTNSLAASLLQAESLVDTISDYRASLGNSQQMSLASELEGGGMQNIQLEAIVTAEQLKLVQNNRGKRTGRGEVVYSKRAR